MALAWNTRQLLSRSKDEMGSATPVEFHFLSRRALYDSTILTAGAVEWAVLGDHDWYSVAVITRPVYAIPQELCLSFDFFSKRETVGVSVIHGPPIDDVALEFGALLSLLVREPLLPLGTRRIGGKPLKLGSYSHVYRPLPSQPIPSKGINSIELRTILCGLSDAGEDDSNAILAAARLYHAALSLSAYDVSTAYFSLVAAIECLSGHHFQEKRNTIFDEVEKFKKAGAVIGQISTLIANDNLIENLKREMLRAEDFAMQKFREFIKEFLPEEFWQQRDELHRDGTFAAIEKSALKKFLNKVYGARSNFGHKGTPFPAYVEVGISEVDVRAVAEILALAGSTEFVPPFIWFERLTHFVLREYLFRVIAPTLAQDRASRAKEKDRLLEVIRSLCELARTSLERLTRWTARFVGYDGVINPMAPNREWALDEASIQGLLSAGLIAGDSQSMDGSSWIKNREIGEIVGEFFFGADQNPLKDNTILNPE
jgi:hypothetical protein